MTKSNNELINKATSTSFSFDNPRSLDDFQITNLFECFYNGKFYEMPFNVMTHGKYFHQLNYLRSGLTAKANILASCLIDNELINYPTMLKIMMDLVWFGNAYVEKVLSRTGKLLAINHIPAKYMRRDKTGFVYIPQGVDGFSLEDSDTINYSKNQAFHLSIYDVNQEIYGTPDWLPAIVSGQLNQEAAKFRLRYYQNGSHAGYIMYMTDPNLGNEEIDTLQEQLKQSKGPGNFRNLLLYAPNGNPDGIKLLPISEVTAKDEFFNIKVISRDDQLAATRVPPQLMGIVPTNTSGLGNPTDAANVFARNEVIPLQRIVETINPWIGKNIFKFNRYQIEPNNKL